MPALPPNFRDRLLPIVLGQATGLLCGVIGVRLASSLIAPADYGRYGIYLTFTPLGMWVIHAGVIKYISRYWAEAKNRATMLRCVQSETWRRAGWLVLLGAVGAMATSASDFTGLSALLFATMLALSFAAIGHTLLLADRKHWWDYHTGAVASVSRAVVPALAYWGSGGVFLALPAGFLIHALVDAVWVNGLARKMTRHEDNGGKLSKLPAEFTGWNFIIQAIAGWTALGLTRWLVMYFQGDQTAGFFNLASNLAIILPSMMGTVLTQYFQPDLFAAPCKTAAERRALAARVDRIALLHIAGSLVALGVLHLLLPWLVGSVISEKYADATAYVFPAGCFFVSVVMTQFHVQLLLAGGRADRIAWLETSKALALAISGIAAISLGGEFIFLIWLICTPALPWVLSRTLARRWFFEKR